MTQETQITAQAMQAFGGSFVAKLGAALAAADESNAVHLMTAFYDTIARYGPGTTPYASVERRQIPQPEVSDSSFGEFQELSK